MESLSELVLKEGPSIEDILSREGVIASVTAGASMRPLFRTHRDVVILERADKPLQKYDVALYKNGSKYILHRVIKVDEKKKTYVIRGDNTYKLEYVQFGAPLARLVSFNRRGKSVSVTDSSYRFYSAFWNFIYPIRFVIYSLLRLAKRIVKKIIRRPQKNSK